MIAHGIRFCDDGIGFPTVRQELLPIRPLARRREFWVWIVLAAISGGARADQGKPIPDIVSLMHQVQSHQRELDKTRESYTYRAHQTINELDRYGNTKKIERRESQVFFVNSHQVERLVGKDGKPLDAADQEKENERVQKEIAKAQRTPPGEMVDENGQISVGRLLSIETFTNPRRLELDQRSVLAFDFAGNPNATTHGLAENASKNLVGTIWIDEQDRQVRRVQATLHDSFRVGFGLFSLSKGSSFAFDQKLVNDELWLPTSASVHIEAHAIGLIGYRADVQIVYDDYQRFHTEAK
jgi:hypothetical protein